MQDSNAAATATGTGADGQGPETDRMVTTGVSSNGSALSLPFFLSSFFFRSCVWSCGVKASAIGGLLPTLFSSSQTLDDRLYAAIATPPKFQFPGLHPKLLHDKHTSISTYSPILTCASSDVS
jgi:hypothetical protein